MAIPRTRVDSTAIASLGYEAERQILEVEFSSGKVYRYFDVPPNVARHFWTATSKGVWFNRAIRDQFNYASKQGARTPVK